MTSSDQLFILQAECIRGKALWFQAQAEVGLLEALQAQAPELEAPLQLLLHRRPQQIAQMALMTQPALLLL